MTGLKRGQHTLVIPRLGLRWRIDNQHLPLQRPVSQLLRQLIETLAIYMRQPAGLYARSQFGAAPAGRSLPHQDENAAPVRDGNIFQRGVAKRPNVALATFEAVACRPPLRSDVNIAQTKCKHYGPQPFTRSSP